MGVVLGYIAVQLIAAVVAIRRGATAFVAFLAASFILPGFGFATLFFPTGKSPRTWSDFSLGGAIKMVLMVVGGFCAVFFVMVAIMTGFFTWRP